MTNSKKNISHNSFVEETEKFVIPQDIYNKMVYDILGVQKIDEKVILSFINIQGEIKQKIDELCQKQNVQVSDFLQRSIVGLRTEKHVEYISLLEYGKNTITNYDTLSDDEIVKRMKKTIEQKASKFLVLWPDGTINYIASNDNLFEERKRRESIKKQYEIAQENSAIKRQIAQNTLTISDLNLLDKLVVEAAKISDQIGKGKTLELYLKGKFPAIAKLYSIKAQQYFYPRYLKAYNENFPNIQKEIYPPDRKIVSIHLSHNSGVICKVRGEQHIINLVVDKINQWKIKLTQYIESDTDKMKVQFIVQKIIDEYYQFLRMYEYKTISASGKLRFEPLDLEKVSSQFSVLQNKEVVVLSHGEFNDILYSQAKESIIKKSFGDKLTKEKQNELIDNIPKFEGFFGVLDTYKDYFLSVLEEDDPQKRIKIPSRIKCLEEYGFLYLRQGNKLSLNKRIGFKLKDTK